MQTVNAFTRLTHKYAAGWRHLDEEQFVGTVRLTPHRRVDADTECDYDQGGTYTQHARAPSGVDIKQLMRAMAQTMSGSSCRHEHDCCGCASYYVSVRHLGQRRLFIRTRISYNY